MLFNVSFFTVRYHSDMHAFVDGVDKGKMPLACEVEEGIHHFMIRYLTNFRWKEVRFDLDIRKNTGITAKYNPFWGTVKILVDNDRIK